MMCSATLTQYRTLFKNKAPNQAKALNIKVGTTVCLVMSVDHIFRIIVLVIN
jgi:hypothetical protein